jgi:hypothetical protein
LLDRLRAGEPLSAAERRVHESAACGVLRDLHDELDALVARAYGWPWPLDPDDVLARLVALHGERAADEAAGQVRWLRPGYQAARFGAGALAPSAATAATAAETGHGEEALELALGDAAAADAGAAAAPRGVSPPAGTLPWPAGAVEQLAAVQAVLARRPLTVAAAAAAFAGAPVALVARHLETLALIGEAVADGAGEYRVAETKVAVSDG